MKKSFITCLIFLVTADVLFGAFDGARIDEITGLKGKLNEKENVYRITFPRADVKVAVDGWTMPPQVLCSSQPM